MAYSGCAYGVKTRFRCNQGVHLRDNPIDAIYENRVGLLERRLVVIRYLSNCQLSLQYNLINIAIYCFF